MTALGKTLVFFNLLFSLVTGGLIVMVFLTRTNWRLGMEAAQQETKAAQAAMKAERLVADQEKTDFAAAKKKLEDDKVELNKKVGQYVVEVANWKKQYEDANANAKTQLTVTQSGSAEIARLQLERNQMADQQRELNDQLSKKNVELANMTQSNQFFKLRSESLERDLSSTNETLAVLRRKYEEMRAQGGSSAGARPNAPRVPSVDTTGRVTGVSGNIATVSLGSDNGIEQGHILQVYRITPDPVFLGTLTVTRAEAYRSAGVFQPAGGGKRIAIDDRVDTKIQP